MLEKKNSNQRRMLTKYLVHEALLKLLKEKSINKISIKELCQVAGINRTTFYNHYGSQYDVLNEIAEAYMQSTSFTMLKESERGRNIYECLVSILEYMKENIEFAKLMLEQEHYDLFTQIIKSLPQFDQMVIKHLPEKLDLDKRNAIASYVQYGSVKLLKEWILSDCMKSPEEEAMLILSIAGKTISNW